MPNLNFRPYGNRQNCGTNTLHGEWKFQKDFMYTPRANTFSNGFGRNQIKRYIKRVLDRNIDQMKQEIKRIEALCVQCGENMKYDYHYSDD